jgi:GrpB-like predicted nucleotidyltransferase (UPF0157 family)
VRSQSDHAPIEIAEYDPVWPERFRAEAAIVSAALAPWLCGAVEHIGSTAVPGLAAKPVIDMMAPVASLPGSRGAIAAAQSIGYLYAPYKTEEMHWFCKPSPAHRTHHLHVVEFGSATWRERLLLREALRQDRQLAARYAMLKRELAARHRHDREAYTQAKAQFIRAAIEGHRPRAAS